MKKTISIKRVLKTTVKTIRGSKRVSMKEGKSLRKWIKCRD